MASVDKLRDDIRALANAIAWNAVELERTQRQLDGEIYGDAIAELIEARSTLERSLHVLRRELATISPADDTV